MSSYFSDLLAERGSSNEAATAVVSGFKAAVGNSHARLRKSVGRANTADSTGFQTTDTVRMVTLKSGDRLHKLELTADGTATAGAVNVGLYLSGAAHNGAVVDVDLFASAVTISTELDLTDVFAESTTLDGVDRGRTLWELAALGAGSDTVDPLVKYDFVIVPSTNFDDDTELTLVATYTAGD